MNDVTIGNPQQTLSATDIAWMAGFLDGEGSILLFLDARGDKLHGCSPQVVVGNTEKVLIDNYVRILHQIPAGVHVSVRHQDRISNGLYRDVESFRTGRKYKALYVASSAGIKRVKAVLDVVTPYLKSIKKKKAELILKYINIRLSSGNETYDRDKANKICSFNGCDNKAKSRGLCDKHYMQYLRSRTEEQKQASRSGVHTVESLSAMLDILRLQNNKYTPIIERMLRDYTRGQLTAA